MKNLFMKIGVIGAAVLPVAAFAEGETPLELAIQEVSSAVDAGLAGGLTVATAVVVGLFAIWAVKLLMRGK